MARARKKLGWEKQIQLASDPVKARQYRELRNKSAEEACSSAEIMCNEGNISFLWRKN
jgi:phosphomethylpyrimidine synthase